MTSINNNNEHKIQEILSRFKQGDKEKVDSIVEYTELSIFLKENFDSLTSTQKQRINEQLKNYNARNITSGARYDKNSNSNIDKSTVYASKTYQLAGTNYLIDVDVHPNLDGSGVTKLVDIYNPKTNKSMSVEDFVYRFDIGEGVAEEELSDFQKICRNIKNKYGCDFREYIGFYYFNGIDLSFKPPGKANLAENTEVTSERGTKNTNSTDGLYDIKGEKIKNIKPIEETASNQKYAHAFNLILQRFNETISAYNEAYNESSIYTIFAEAFRFWGPSIKDAKNAIKNMESNILTLKTDLELNDFTKFETDFSKIFGKAFDSEAIQNYNNNCNFYTLVNQKQTTLEAFKQYRKDLLDTVPDMNSGISVSDEVADALYSKMLGLLGGNETELRKLINQSIQSYIKNNQGNPLLSSLTHTEWSQMGNRERCLFLNMVAKELEAKFEADLYNTTGGKSFKDVKNAHQALYEKAFGTTNDAFKTVENFCEYQQIGTQITRGIVMAGTLITVGVASGGLAFVTVPLATYGTDIVVSATDEATKNKALDILNTKGPMAYLDHMIEDVNWGEICSQAKTNATMSVLFMGQAHVISNVCRIAGTAAGLGEKAILGATMGTQMAGDAALGSALEYAATGEITVNGVVFIVVMDIVGNAIHIKDYHKKTKASKSDSGLGFNQKEVTSLSKHVQKHSAVIDIATDIKNLNSIKVRVQNDATLTTTEKAYLLQQCDQKIVKLKSSKAKHDELEQKIKQSPGDTKTVINEINESDLTSAQKKSLVNKDAKPFVPSDNVKQWLNKLQQAVDTGILKANGKEIVLNDGAKTVIKEMLNMVNKGEISENMINALVSRKGEGLWEEALSYIEKGTGEEEIFDIINKEYEGMSEYEAMMDLYNNYGIMEESGNAKKILIQKRAESLIKLMQGVSEINEFVSKNTNSEPISLVRYETGNTTLDKMTIDGKSLAVWMNESNGDYTHLCQRLNQGNINYTFDFMAGTSLDTNFNNFQNLRKFKWNIKADAGKAHGMFTDVIYAPQYADEVEWLMAKGTTLKIERAWVDENGLLNIDAKIE